MYSIYLQNLVVAFFVFVAASFSSCNHTSPQKNKFEKTPSKDSLYMINIQECDSIYIKKLWQGRGWRFPELHFRMNRDSVWIYSDSVELSQYGKLSIELENRKNTLFDLLRNNLKREPKKKFRLPMDGGGDSMLDYRIYFFKNNIVFFDTTFYYGADYENFSPELFLFMNNLNSLTNFYNSIIRKPNWQSQTKIHK